MRFKSAKPKYTSCHLSLFYVNKRNVVVVVAGIKPVNGSTACADSWANDVKMSQIKINC